MNIEYLRYFLDVVDTKSITQAARLNFISPQGMSRAMSELEKELDCTLLERFPNKLGLTKECKQLIPAITEVVTAYDNLIEQTDRCRISRSLDETAGESIRLLCQPISSFCFFPAEIMDGMLRGGNIRCLEADNHLIFQELEGLVDESTHKPAGGTIGLTCLFDPKRADVRRTICELENVGYLYKPFITSYDMVMVSAKSELAAKDMLDDEDILSQQIITSNSEMKKTVSHLFGERAISITSGNVSFRRQTVARGDTISFMPAISMLNWDDSETVLKPFSSRYEIELGFIGTEEDFANESFKGLIADLTDWYKAHDDPCLFTLVWR